MKTVVVLVLALLAIVTFQLRADSTARAIRVDQFVLRMQRLWMMVKVACAAAIVAFLAGALLTHHSDPAPAQPAVPVPTVTITDHVTAVR